MHNDWLSHIKSPLSLNHNKDLNNPFSAKAKPFGFAEKKSSLLAALTRFFFSQSLVLQKKDCDQVRVLD